MNFIFLVSLVLTFRGKCIQNFHSGRRIDRYMVGNSFTAAHKQSRKTCFRRYTKRYTSRNENFEYVYPHSIVLLQSRRKLERCKLHKVARCPRKCHVINDVKLFLTVYRRIYCSTCLTLSNQMSHYKASAVECIIIIIDT